MPTKQISNTAWLFEASWEVCNKTGGIHTVIVSKIAEARAAFPNRYLPIGPYFPSSHTVFREVSLPASFQEVAAALGQQGVQLHYGYWLIDPETPVLLLDWQALLPRLNEYKKRFWEEYQLDSLGTAYFDVDEPLLWSVSVGLFTNQFASQNAVPLILHLHEWLAAGALLVLDRQNNHIRTVFTAHATVLGRALSGQGRFLHSSTADINPDVEAHQAGVGTKHQIEKLGATLSTVFTTVSQTTAKEAEVFLGRRADQIVENGLETSRFPNFDYLTEKRRVVRERLKDFIAAYFFPSYRFPLSNLSFQFTMGRYEVHNKGYDLYLESLGELNRKLQEGEPTSTVIAFFLIPKEKTELKAEIATELNLYQQAQAALSNVVEDQKRELIRGLWEHENQPFQELIAAVGNAVLPFLSRLPDTAAEYSPFVIHDSNDAILQLAKQHGLHNRPEDRVKLLYFPIYLDELDGIFNLSLYDFISGFDLGVFPSLYEPWGYTPMESLAMGVPAITSTTAGFGQAVESRNIPNQGVFLLNRTENQWQHEVDALTEILSQNIRDSEREWLNRRIAAYTTVQNFDWQHLYERYEAAYRQALEI